MPINTNGKTNGQLIPHMGAENLVERFATRLLRRELFEQLHDKGFVSEVMPNAKLTMFGSGVVQIYRPKGGFPISRQARDLDLGFVVPNQHKNEEIPPRLQRELEEHMGQIAREIGADAEILDSGELIVKKIYSGTFLKKRTAGNPEEALVDPHRDITVQVKIPRTYMRSPLLPLVPYGNKGFYHEDVREVLGTKLMRMTGPKENFAIRDVIDFYNMMSIDASNGNGAVFDIKRDAELLRCIAIANIASQMALNLKYDNTLDSLNPNSDANIDIACRQLDIPLSHKEELRSAYKTVYDAVTRTVFPQRGNLPPKLAGPLGFSRDELSFMTQINGVEQLPGGINVRRVMPIIDSGLIVSYALGRAFPELQHNIESKHELTQALNRAQVQAQIGNDGAPSFDDGGFGAGF